MRPLDRQAMVLVVVTLVADQLSKQLLLAYLLKAGAIVPVIDGFFRLVVVWNNGVSLRAPTPRGITELANISVSSVQLA